MKEGERFSGRVSVFPVVQLHIYILQEFEWYRWGMNFSCYLWIVAACAQVIVFAVFVFAWFVIV